MVLEHPCALLQGSGGPVHVWYAEVAPKWGAEGQAGGQVGYRVFVTTVSQGRGVTGLTILKAEAGIWRLLCLLR